VFGPGYTETQRGWAKNGVFAHFFGAGLEKLAATIQAPLEVAAAVVEALGVVAPGVAAWADQVKQAVRNGMNQFRTYSGRIIHLDTSQPHKAVNYLVQGTARELLVDTLLAWDDGPYAGGVIVPVHDEVIAWVDEADADAATDYLVRCMTRDLYGVSIICEPDPPSDRWDSYSS
jgi:DNA polymerase I-like protein with 3'-5' exonuclease and polymerase domains